MLDCGAAAGFGYVDVRDGFAFLITGSECQYDESSLAEPDNIVISTNVSGSIATNFFVEYVTASGSWKTLLGTVSAGDISHEAVKRGVGRRDFLGIYVKSLGGDDIVRADGGGLFGIRSGARIEPIRPGPLVGQSFIVDSGSGNDDLWGSPGPDMMRGGPGNDALRGMAGNDSLLGSTGNDTLVGDDGDDYLRGDEGHDLIDGHAGDDLLRGGDGDDTLSGQSGDDTLAGEAGHDDIQGDAGKDSLLGGDGDDSLLGDHLDHNPSGGIGVDAWQAGDTTDAGIVIQNVDIERIYTTGADPGEPTLENGHRFDRPGPFGIFGPFNFDDQVDSSLWLSLSLVKASTLLPGQETAGFLLGGENREPEFVIYVTDAHMIGTPPNGSEHADPQLESPENDPAEVLTNEGRWTHLRKRVRALTLLAKSRIQ